MHNLEPRAFPLVSDPRIQIDHALVGFAAKSTNSVVCWPNRC